jgi:hypothetical protein
MGNTLRADYGPRTIGLRHEPRREALLSKNPMKRKPKKDDVPTGEATEPRSPEKDYAVCFIEALAEELVEVDALRAKRALRQQAQSPDWASVNKIKENAGWTERKLKTGDEAADEADAVIGEAHKMGLVGLAFSGGGIRSATFNLGILQGLGEYGKLHFFDFLSTVSGGGYIGSWLEAWVWRAAETESRNTSRHVPPDQGLKIVERELQPTRTARNESVGQAERNDQHSHTEPPPIRYLREYSNYLTPRLGVLGADTWTVVGIYLRNLLVNQSVLTLFLATLLLLPYIAESLTLGAARQRLFTWPWTIPVTVFVLMTFALSVGMSNLRGLIDCKQLPKNSMGGMLPPQKQSWVIATVIAPVFVAAWLVTAWLWPQIGVWDQETYLRRWILGGIALLGLPMSLSCLAAPRQESAKDAELEMKHRKAVWSICALLMGGLSGLMMLALTHEVFARLQQLPGQGWHELSLGVPLTLGLFLTAATMQMGLMGRTFFDPYREWWSRVSGWTLILTIVWCVGFALTIYAPLGLMWLRGWLRAAGFAWIGTTLVGVLGGKSSKTGAEDEAGSTKVLLLSMTPYVFIVGLVSLLALALELILARFQYGSPVVQSAWTTFLAKSPAVEKVANWVLHASGTIASGAVKLDGTVANPAAAHGAPGYIVAHFVLLDQVLGTYLAIAWAGTLLLCWLLSWRVDLNEFSMNLMYRNRLVRCYLGATHEGRQGNPFSGLDCCDDLLLSALRSDNSYSGPLPIINTTLNLVDSRELAWQERKAESFPMTPWRCGFDTWIEQVSLDDNYAHDRVMGDANNIEKYAYRPTLQYAYKHKGFYLGTAVSISGAAASPNMGYHSVPSLAMLMTFFNVRLGFWAGNPRNSKTWKEPGPKVGLWRLLGELFGLTDDNSDYVYLSDGGHFENLGVYELLKRRCKFIIACDAGEDPDYSLEDLGNAVRKCREDIGVEIELLTKPVVPQSSDKDSSKKQTQWHCVVGKIHYEDADIEADTTPGIFVYIKASLTGDEPADVLNYQTAHPAFPHQTTADQWFTESQFESYRRLGQHVVDTMFKKVEEDSMSNVRRIEDPERLFLELERCWGKEAIEKLKD